MFRNLLFFICALALFISGMIVGSQFGRSYEKKTSYIQFAGATYLISEYLRKEDRNKALLTADNALRDLIPEIHDAASSSIFSYLPGTKDAKFHERHFVDYLASHRPLSDTKKTEQGAAANP